MGLLNRDKMAAVYNAASDRWHNQLAALKPDYPDWAFVIPSVTGANIYTWVDLMVQIREWIGERKLGSVRAQAVTIPNKPYEGSFGLKVDDINDDQVGMLLPLLDALLAGAVFHPQNLLWDVALLAYSTLCHDGQYFLDTDHPTLNGDGNTVSNLSTDPLSYDAVNGGLIAIRSLVGADGKPLQLQPYALMTGPSLEPVAKQLYLNEKKPGSMNDENALRGTLKPVMNGVFIGNYASYWIILARSVGGALTPFIYQEREKPELACTAIEVASPFSGITAQDIRQFMAGDVAFGTSLRGAATFTLWPLAYGSTGSGV
jgi:phage major head subunit gpT-like protein